MFFRRGGTGVGIGKACERDYALEINPDWGIYYGDANLIDKINNTGEDMVLKRANAPADLNNAITSGFYRINSGHTNIPSEAAYGQLIVVQGGGDTITQLAFSYNGLHMWARSGNVINNASGSWSEWHRIYDETSLYYGTSDPGGYKGRIWLKPKS